MKIKGMRKMMHIRIEATKGEQEELGDELSTLTVLLSQLDYLQRRYGGTEQGAHVLLDFTIQAHNALIELQGLEKKGELEARRDEIPELLMLLQQAGGDFEQEKE